MIFTDFNDFYVKLPKDSRLLGIDWGQKRIGIAISDFECSFALPKKIISGENQDKAITEIKDIINQYNINGIVLGFPLAMDGLKSKTCEKIEVFADKLQNLIDINILFYDERLTSASAESMLIEDLNMNRNKRKKVLDQVASTIILQDVLDKIKRKKYEA